MTVRRSRSSLHPFVLSLVVIVFALIVALLAPLGIVRAQDGTPVAEPAPVPIQPASEATLGYPGLTIIATDSGFVVPEGITAGRYYETHQNAGSFWSHFFTI